MATTWNLHNRIASDRAERRAAKLRSEMRFDEARNGPPMGAGCAVLHEARQADINGDDDRFASKPDPRY